ncbi:uncharacterized protein LOC116192498 [Punica granatum]|uniref:Uncharacterized protein n=2 Tax=Punica granatum TaxID=22663 RepID=A0A218XP73_PUNGR|nr:uncharacterized protein LOC116192498 [Punica granatum]OWM86446.1 hypothetical protein CDL15_Pgr021533 [Punica granatum]PKI39821.1 hypothetical protein CRG98_039866 [Punica granatum]
MLGCSSDGNLDEAGFSRPMPWIGLYIAVASLACGLAMGADALTAFRCRKFWFPCRYLSLNATSLTVISVAIKLSVDLNTAMPRQQDQLSKLSSSALICTVMANSMPSLGNMGSGELLSNIIALAILVITAIVNISIQISTGVIYTFLREHIFLMFLMLLLLLMLSFSAMTVPTTKTYLEMKYCKKHELTLKEKDRKSETVIERLKEDLMKYWMMAYTGSPQFVVGRSVTCTASGALCLLSATALAEAMTRSYVMAGRFKFCTGESDYGWSSTMILIVQTIAVGIGTIAPALRWFVAIKFKCPKMVKKSFKDDFKLEKYWIKMLVEMKECPFFLQFRSRQCRRMIHGLKNEFLGFCIRLQAGIVLGSKVIRLISILFMSQILISCQFIKELTSKFESKNSIANEDSHLSMDRALKLDLSRYVLHLEGEEELVHSMMRNNWNTTEHFVKMGKKKEPKYLIRLLEDYHSHGFGGVLKFDSDRVSTIYHAGEEPPRCWALPIVTLASIAVAIPSIEQSMINQLLHSINEGLKYVELIEENLSQEQDITNVRKAANIVWLGVDLYHRWLDMDLRKLSCLQGDSPRDVLETLSEAAKNMLVDFKEKPVNECLMETPSRWPIKVLAAHSMYRITQTMLLDCRESCDENLSRKILETLLVTVSDILGACLTNLERVISMECCRSTIEERKESVQRAGVLIGKIEKVIEILSHRHVPNLSLDQMASIDKWRTSDHLRNLNDSPLTAFNEVNTKDSIKNSAELHLSIEYS